MDYLKKIYEDERPIQGIYFDEGRVGWSSGAQITRIRPYTELEAMSSCVTWFTVFEGDQIVARVPSRMVQVHYKKG